MELPITISGGMILVFAVGLLTRYTLKQESRVSGLEESDGWCNYRLEGAFRKMRQRGIEVPDDWFGPPPEWWKKGERR